MPSMYEIYDAHSDRYHELVMREDYQGNLARALKRVATWSDAVVVEAAHTTGAGAVVRDDPYRSVRLAVNPPAPDLEPGVPA